VLSGSLARWRASRLELGDEPSAPLDGNLHRRELPRARMMAQQTGAAPRTKVLPSRVTGKILDWKGTFGWIQADAPINHPAAQKRSGRIYLSQLDVEAEIMGIGSRVSFFVYADNSGLGAMGCRPAASPVVATTIARMTPQQPKAPPPSGLVATPVTGGASTGWSTGTRNRLAGVATTGQVKEFNSAYGWIVPSEPIKHPAYRGQVYFSAHDVDPVQKSLIKAGTKVRFSVYTDSQGIGADQIRVALTAPPGAMANPLSAGVPNGGGKPVTFVTPRFAPAVPRVPLQAVPTEPRASADLPRERITEIMTTGEVVEWKGTFGWIEAHDAIDHALAYKRQGKVFLSKKDFKGGMPEAGLLVQFHVFADSSGLGAEECSPF